MKLFIGTKLVRAEAMTRQAYNDFRGWTQPKDEDGSDAGYLVEYQDGGKPNTPTHAGYVSWSPAEQFEKAYRQTDGLPFGLALEALKMGSRITRQGWNGKGMWLGFVPALLADKVAFQFSALSGAPWIGLKNADDRFVPWQPSIGDTLAEDWVILD